MIGGAQVDGLATALKGAGVAEVLTYVPEEIVPPLAIVQPAEDYLTQDGITFGEWRLSLELYLLVELVGNEQATEDLDDLLRKALGVLDRSVWSVDGMSKPGPFHSTSWLSHGIRLRISTETALAG